jgi:hypothetical protein
MLVGCQFEEYQHVDLRRKDHVQQSRLGRQGECFLWIISVGQSYVDQETNQFDANGHPRVLRFDHWDIA